VSVRLRLAALASALWTLLLAGAGTTITVAQAQSTPAPAPGVEFVAALQDALQALPPQDSVPTADPRLLRVRAPLHLARDLAPNPAAIDPILAALAGDPADVATARTRLRTLVAAVSLPTGSVAEDPHASRRALDDVYAQSQFAGLGRRPSDDDLFSRIGRGLLSFFQWLAQHTVGTIGAVPTAIIAGLVIAAIVAWVLWRMQRSGTAIGLRRSLGEPAGRGVDAEEEWRLALAAAERADHREAVRHAFRSALLAVAEKGRLQVDASLTTSELLARARGDADLVAALAPAADSFNRAWYSGRPVSAQDWEVARDRCLAVRALAARGRRAVGAGGVA
jgi:Domain of unknown function (DUF4129)